MKFIPQGLKNLFSRKSKKAEATSAETAPEAEVIPPPAEITKESVAAWRLDKLKQYQQPGGQYELSLEIANPTPANAPNMLFHLLRSEDAEFYMALVGPSQLAGCKTIATEIEEHMQKTYGLDVGKVYFKRVDADFYIDGYDQIIGLPSGEGFKLVVVPEGCSWQPERVMPPQSIIPGTLPILQHPATLLPQFALRQPWKLLMINGFNVVEPQFPEITQPKPVLAPLVMRQEPPKEEPKKEEAAKEAVAVPAGFTPAPPPPPKM